MFFKEQPKQKLVPLEFHQMQQKKWDDFIKVCEKFERVEFKGGCARGYKEKEVSGELYNGTKILIPFEYVTPFIEE